MKRGKEIEFQTIPNIFPDGAVKIDIDKTELKQYLDVWFEISPCQSMGDTLINIVESLLEHSWSHVLLLLVLV